LAGLDPEDVNSLLGSAQGFGNLNQSFVRTYLEQKNKREAVQRAERLRRYNAQAAQVADTQKRNDAAAKEATRVEELQNKQARADNKEVRTHQQAFDIQAEKARLTAEAKAATTPAEKKIAALNLRKLEADVKKAEAGEDGGLTPSEKLNREKYNDKVMTDILDPDQPLDVSEFKARKENMRDEGNVYFLITDSVDRFDFGTGWRDTDAGIAPVYLPLAPDGHQLTSKDVIDSARAAGVSEEQILKDWKAL